MEKIRSLICTVVGHVDHGKCVHPTTQIPLVDGRIEKIENLWEELAKKNDIKKTEGGEYIEIKDLSLFSFNASDKCLTTKNPQILCKLKSPKELIKCKTTLNTEITVTPEHPFFVLDSLEIKEKRADELKEGDGVLYSRQLNGKKLSYSEIVDYIFNKIRDNNLFVCKPDNILLKKIDESSKSYKIIDIEKEIHGLYFRYSLKRGIFRLEHLVKLCSLFGIKEIYNHIELIKQSSLKQRVGHTSKWIKLPQSEQELKDLFYLVGLLTGDGLSRGEKLFNEDDEVLEKCSLVLKNMGIDSIIRQGRTCREVYHKGGETFYYFLNKLFDFPQHKKSCTVGIPEIVQLADEKFSGEYLSGYFDTDGYSDVKQGQIAITTASKNMAEKLPLLLLYFGCLPHYREKKANNGKNYHEFIIAGKKSLDNFNKKIGFRLTRKQKNLNLILKKSVSNRKLDIFPWSYGEIKKLRISLGLNKTELNIPYWGRYEKDQNLTLEVFKRFMQKINESKDKLENKIKEKIRLLQNLDNKKIYYNNLINLINDGLIVKDEKGLFVTNFGKEMLRKWEIILKNSSGYINKILSFDKFTNTDLCFVKIKSIERILSDTEWVYDFTENDTKTFVADGFIVHNTTILDQIRGTAVAACEAGAITQCISCTKISFDIISEITKNAIDTKKIKIPGLLFLDTPGHAAFNNLRRRGGNLADIAILVVDINEGVKPQTLECIDILKKYKTPFIIALNKIDLLSSWRTGKDGLLKSINSQGENTKELLDKKLYNIVGKLSEFGLNSERFDRVDDFTKQIAMVPVSAKTKEGLPELLAVLTGLAQKFLEKKLKIDSNKEGKGVILEVEEEQGIGVTLNVVLYDGMIKEKDQIVIGGIEEPIVTKVKALYEPGGRKCKELIETKEVVAAAGVKIFAPGISGVVSGMPLRVANKDVERVKKEIQEEINEVLIETDNEGIIVKADSLGSLEALIGLLKEKKVLIKKANIGDINKKDITAASAEEIPWNRAVVGFNVKVKDKGDVKIINHNIIYKIVDELEKWQNGEKRRSEDEKLKSVRRPFKLMVLTGCVFRQSNPAVVGVEVLAGTLKTGRDVLNENGKKISEVKSIQLEGENINEIEKGKQVAISLPGATVGRNLFENEVLYSDIHENDFRKIKELKRFLKGDEVELLKEIAMIKRKNNPMWGI